jgi:hypothetical protein
MRASKGSRKIFSPEKKPCDTYSLFVTSCSYLKMLLTELSSYTRQMVSPRRLATDKTVSCGK